MKRIKPEELVKDQKYLVELKFKNDDGGKRIPLEFENTENADDFAYFGKDVKIYSLEENDKVIIPKFVAEWLEECKSRNLSVGQAIEIVNSKEQEEIFDWFWDKGFRDNQLRFARAWLDGYKVEKKPLYWVRTITGQSLLYKRKGLIEESVGNDIKAQEDLKEEYTFTEKEIKDYDERYWAFAVPVEEE